MSETEQNQEVDATEVESAATGTETEEVTIESLTAKLAEAEAKAEENWDQLVRSKAEMENIRRRSERDLTNAHKYALEKFAQELLPVIDSMEMGVAAAQDENADVSKLREGTEMTLKMFETVIDKFGIKGVHPHGEAFNPEHHQAMTMIDSPEHQPNTIIDVMQKGYLLNERLVRPAMVVVSSANSGTGSDTSSSDTSSSDKKE
ncbi:MAG: nucleotide exchange factor GrpE [Gammaproteobacteria bacterium]|nr:nucleotide exchange factor GrpE [Gammaproteobacteria bacterium]MCW8988589.1 nucleotide exchange factor GrpE [Gammaproteobacteria bacterium]MCW9031871.1 nucleotide exchange factor GrpE [Gammaproteobacteria bacterium]